MSIKTGLDNKRVAMNILFNCVAYIINAFISLFITPYITSRLGAEAYGFAKLANDFSAYGSLLTLALNSMASRFIMLKMEKGDMESARSYYTSITVANIIMSIVLFIPTIVLIGGVNILFDVPDNLISDVRWTFVWTLSNFLICLSCTTFGNCFFLKNRLDISSSLTSITSIIRAVFIIIAFMIGGPSISVMAFGSIVVTAIFVPCNIFFHRKLTPKLYFDKKTFDIKKVIEVISAGIWNSITRLSGILTNGLDLMVSNLFLGALEMGYLSVAKTVPNFISALINAIGNSFTPNMMQLYSKEDLEGLKKAIRTSMRIMTVFSTIPNAILISFGVSFYELWVPEQPANFINILSIVTIIETCITGPMQPIYQVFTITNKIRQSSIVVITKGFISIGVTLVLVKYFNLGLYAIAGVSVVLQIITSLCYHLPLGSYYAGYKWYTFYGEVLKTIIILVIQCVIGLVIAMFIPMNKSWINWFRGGCLLGVTGLIITMLGILNRQERKDLINMVMGRMKIKWRV